MPWQVEYTRKCTTAQAALSQIVSGNRVVVQHAAGEPSFLLDALVAAKDQFRDVEIVHQVPLGRCAYCQPGMEPHFHHNSLFAGKNTREALASGRADFTPCFNFEIPRLFSEGYLPVDVALIHVCPPDADGYVSLGISVDYTYQAAMSAKVVIAQVNAHMPRTHGQSRLHVRDITSFVLHDAPVLQLKPAPVGDVERAIGEHCASLVRDGDTLQLGIGSIPDAVLSFLTSKRDLGIHSEMISDGVMELTRAGVITNARKTLHPGKSVVTFLMGSQALYDFVHDNPMIEMRPVDYVTSPLVIMQNDNMVSINSCVQVDLYGQVCSECVGYEQISGPGGQVDFVRGAGLAKNGRSIIAMPSTAAGGRLSKVVANLDAGACVTTSRHDVHYVVTEYGIAQLRGKSLRQRARALINIAHPAFRDSLNDEFEKRFHCRPE